MVLQILWRSRLSRQMVSVNNSFQEIADVLPLQIQQGFEKFSSVRISQLPKNNTFRPICKIIARHYCQKFEKKFDFTRAICVYLIVKFQVL